MATHKISQKIQYNTIHYKIIRIKTWGGVGVGDSWQQNY